MRFRVYASLFSVRTSQEALHLLVLPRYPYNGAIGFTRYRVTAGH